MKLDFANLQYQYQLYKSDIDKRIQQVLDKSNYIMGEEVLELENALGSFTGASAAIACSSGTDALILAMLALGLEPGDEVITTPFSFIATAETIALLKARPVFVDVDPATYNIDIKKIEGAITDRTKVILPVSLYGQPADLEEISVLAEKHGLKVIVDGAQSFGATYKGLSEVHCCDIYTTSFFPAKPLGCYGDGGAVFTNNEEYADKMRMLRVHGQDKRYYHKYVGIGGRLDTIQAAVLLAKLPHYDRELSLRRKVASSYISKLDSQAIKSLPLIRNNRTSAYAQFTLRVDGRRELQNSLNTAGIPTAVHYPMPLHLQECFSYLGYAKGAFPVAEELAGSVLSLPMNPFLTEEQVNYVAQVLNCY